MSLITLYDLVETVYEPESNRGFAFDASSDNRESCLSSDWRGGLNHVGLGHLADTGSRDSGRRSDNYCYVSGHS